MYNILVCDDEKDIVNSLNIYLTAEGYTVQCAYNGKEAIALAESCNFHLILLDIMMPIIDGITALSAIRERSNVPIILLTAKSEDTDKVLGLNLGADDYITKPFNPIEMLARVRSQLRRYTQLGGSTSLSESIRIGTIVLDDNARKFVTDDCGKVIRSVGKHSANVTTANATVFDLDKNFVFFDRGQG